MQHHVVQYQLFDVAFTNAGKSYDLQNKISDVFHSQLMDGMDQLFNRLVPDDTLLSLGDVEIDIGNIPYHLIEYDLVNRILFELEHEINHRLALIPSKTSGENNDQQLKKIETGYTDLLEYFLLTGAMPWWASGEVLNDPLAIMQHLITKDAARLKQLIINAGQHSYVRQRLVQQFPQQVIRDVIILLEPAEAEFIFSYHASVIQTHQHEKLVEGATNTEFDKALWLFILTYILVDRGSIFNQKMFVRSTLGQMASHYNLSYAQILALLSKALTRHNLTDIQNSNLTLIISDLSVDEFDQRQQPIFNRLITTTSSAADAVQQNVELIRYFLLFGSLPWWAEPYSESNLVTILLDLAKLVPNALSKLILSAGQNEEVRKRITTVFDDEIITAIIKLVEPANATFIINYAAEVQVIHTKKPAVYSDSKDFKKAIWKFILDFLLVERGSVFNERMFLESNIRKLANSYNVQYAEMLSYLVQSVGQVHQSSMEYVLLFQMLAGLMKDLGQQSTQITEQTTSITKPGAPNTESRSVELKDVLLHWLNYGNIPWWGSKYFDQGPAGMFETLLSVSADNAFLVLKYAGTMLNTRKRLVYQIPQQFILSLLSKQPGGESAVKLYGYFLQASGQLNGEKNASTISNALLLVFWEEYIAGDYKKFNNASFIKKGVTLLFKQLSIGGGINTTSIAKIVGELTAIFTTTNQTDFLNHLNSVTEFHNDDSNWDAPVIDIDLRQLLIQHLEARVTSGQAIAKEALSILEYFLSNNKLPQQFKGSNPAYVKAIIEQLLQLIKKADSAAYKQLLSTNMQLKAYVKDSADIATLISGGIEQLITDYLQQNRPSQKDDIINKALNILAHFLTTGKLPGPFAAANLQQVLKQLLLLLNYERPAAFKDILQHDNYLVTARITLHNLFASTANTAESNVARVLKEHLEKDITRYLDQQTGFVFNNDETLTLMLERYIKQSAGELNLMLPLLKNQAVAKYMARNYTDAQVIVLLNNTTTLIGGAESVSWVNDLQLLITTHITDTLQRARLLTLLREFNLLVLGGHIIAGSFANYLKQLIGFIAAAGYALFNDLSGIMLKAGVTSGLSPVFMAKLSSVLTELNRYNTDHKIQQRIKQQLIRADDNALLNAGINTNKKSIEAKQLKEELKQNQQLDEETTKDENKRLLVNSADTIYINNAGLVLLNPFFATYFVRLGMMEGGKFINADAQLRAVHLLQYMVNGKSNNPEHFLVLNKVFCNLPVEEPVPAEITLTDKEIETSEQMLKAVLQNWEKLKNTSIEGLQQSFLQRDGALVFKDDAWHLTVEQRGYDILLQTLPWTIGMIKTPWMDNFLYVEWI